jgi:hypothetical protein
VWWYPRSGARLSLIVASQYLETTISLLDTGCKTSLEGLETNKKQTSHQSGSQLRAIRGTDIVVQSLNSFQILNKSSLVMFLINTLNNVDLEAGSRSALKTLVECSYGNSGMPYWWNYMSFLEDESSPEAWIEETREFLGRIVDEVLEVSTFVFGAVNRYIWIVYAYARYSRLDGNNRKPFP